MQGRNILLVSSKYMPEYSGSGFRAHNLYSRLLEKSPGLHLEVLCGSVTENESSDYEFEGIMVHRIASKPYPVGNTGMTGRYCEFRNFHSEFSKASRFLLSLSPAPGLVHVFGRNFVTAAACDFAIAGKIPLMVELCNETDYPFQYAPFPAQLWVRNRPVGRHVFVCISEKLKKVCLECGIDEKNIWCRPNPVDERKFAPVCEIRKNELRRKLTKFSDRDRLIVYVAKFRPSKNQKFLVEIMRLLPPEFKLFIRGPLVGKGPKFDEEKKYFDSIVEEVARNGLDDRIQVESGFCENVSEYYQMADVYAFPSISEGLGTPVLESVACAVPVAANRISGVTDTWVEDGQNGYLSDLRPESFADKMLKCASIERDTLIESSRKILDLAGTSVIDRKYLDIMESLEN